MYEAVLRDSRRTDWLLEVMRGDMEEVKDDMEKLPSLLHDMEECSFDE